MSEQAKPSKRKNLRLWLGIAAALVILVVIAQNTAQVETRILFMSITMPRALLLATMLAFGFVLGVLAPRRNKPAA